MEQRVPSFLLAAILIVLLVSAFQGPSGPPEKPIGAEPTSDVGALRERIESIESRLAAVEIAPRRFEESAAVPAVAPKQDGTERRPVGLSATELQALRAEVLDLRQAASRLSAALAKPNELDLGRGRDLPTNRPQVDALVQTIGRDRQEAEQPLLLLSPSEILERFGKPQHVGGKPDALEFKYDIPSISRQQRYLTVRFIGGLASGVYISG